ncbi:MAG: tryptophan--tRNA ligase, partial [Muribaculaceae bacterium]|nr:tryptophan--tRNA ligase [Muribaculaceae bacterium]
MKEIVLSGIRATGNLHLGNYFGALYIFVIMQDDYDCMYFIADLHALTTHPDPKTLHANVKSILSEYLAAGVDPDKATIFVQSDVPEVSELYLLLNMHVGIGELMRTASFKDKARKQLGIKSDSDDIEKEIIGTDSNKRVNAGLLTYPTLMAVDILIQKAHKVPVGKDQEQHLELTRRFARRFNSFYGVDYFPEPANFDFGGSAIKVPGLDGSGKMGKSEGNCIYLIDEEKVLRKKVMRAVTDEGPQASNSPVSQPIQNLFTLMELTSTPETVQQFRDAYADCSIRYGDL